MGEETASVASRERARASTTFEEFFDAERPRLFRALVLVTHDSLEAEELMQDAFVRVWERWDRVGTMDDPIGYLLRTAMNLHRSRLRRAVTATKRAVTTSAGPDPFDEVAARDEAVRSFAMLTPRQRAVSNGPGGRKPTMGLHVRPRTPGRHAHRAWVGGDHGYLRQSGRYRRVRCDPRRRRVRERPRLRNAAGGTRLG